MDNGQQALALLQQGKLKEAEIIYEQLVREGTGSHVVFGNLAVLRRIQGRTREMIALLRQAIACDCNHANAHLNLSMALLLLLGDYPEGWQETNGTSKEKTICLTPIPPLSRERQQSQRGRTSGAGE